MSSSDLTNKDLSDLLGVKDGLALKQHLRRSNIGYRLQTLNQDNKVVHLIFYPIKDILELLEVKLNSFSNNQTRHHQRWLRMKTKLEELNV